jgi:hypothetical protein
MFSSGQVEYEFGMQRPTLERLPVVGGERFEGGSVEDEQLWDEFCVYDGCFRL